MGRHKTKFMLITINILLCLLNVAMAFKNYEEQSYKSAMFSAFAAGFSASAAIAIVIM